MISLARNLFKTKTLPKKVEGSLTNQYFADMDKEAAAGYGKSYIDITVDSKPTVEKIKANLLVFAASKERELVNEAYARLLDKDGKLHTFKNYLKEIADLNIIYNKNHLETELITTKRTAQAVRQWEDFQKDKDLFTNLKYVTAGDKRVRDDHADLDGVVKPIDDKFWDTYFPPNGWRCRCDVQQSREKVTPGKSQTKVTKGFEWNPGKNKLIWKDDHPYLQNSKDK